MELGEILTQPLDRTEIEIILNKVIDLYLIPKHRSLGMKASGNWEEQLEVRGDAIYGEKYSEQLIYGRRPGTFAPIDPIIEWVKIKFGISDEDEARQIAWAVNTKIKNEGTSYYKQGGTDLLNVLYTDEVTDYIEREAGRIITKKVESYFRDQVKKLQ